MLMYSSMVLVEVDTDDDMWENWKGVNNDEEMQVVFKWGPPPQPHW